MSGWPVYRHLILESSGEYRTLNDSETSFVALHPIEVSHETQVIAYQPHRRGGLRREHRSGSTTRSTANGHECRLPGAVQE